MNFFRLTGWTGLMALLVSMMIGCAESGRNLASDAVTTGGAGTVPLAGGGAAVAEEKVVLFVGTSLTAGYGLSEGESFPMRIQEKIDSVGLPFRAVNAGVSGETSAGALRRVDWLLQQPFDVLVLETGANDMLRGTNPTSTEQNIQAIIDRVRERRPEVVIILAGMLAMPNLGPQYVGEFEALYPRVAQRNRIPHISFLLEGVAAERDLNLADGIHPNAAGQRIVAETVWRALEPVLRAETVRAD
jgi:acyl-CoA thioesterase I